MSVIARFSVPADQFALGDALEVRDGVRIRLESMVPTGTATVPYLWVESDDADAVRAALRDTPLVEDVRLVDDIGPETLIRVDWSADADGLVDAIDDADAVVLEAEGRGNSWSFRLRFPDHQRLSAFYRRCSHEGLALELEELNNPLGSASGGDHGLTETQREALLVALAEGYFDVPRKVSLQDLAGQFGISDTALSQRLRRGLTGLVSSTLFQHPREDRED